MFAGLSNRSENRLGLADRSLFIGCAGRFQNQFCKAQQFRWSLDRSAAPSMHCRSAQRNAALDWCEQYASRTRAGPAPGPPPFPEDGTAQWSQIPA